MDLAIRYLLHGQPDKYNSEEKLYIISRSISRSDSLWSKLAHKVLEITDESWRLIDNSLSETISEEKFGQIGITRLTTSAVIDLLKELLKQKLDCIERIFDQIILSDDERQEILNEIGKNIDNKELWKRLPLHKSSNNKNNKFVSVKENTYLENRDYTLNPQSPVEVIVINQNNKVLHYPEEGWISQWSPSAEIKILLEQPEPHNYTESILRVCQSSPDVISEYHNKLTNTLWLSLSNGDAIAPPSILRYPPSLCDYESYLVQFREGYHLVSDLSTMNYHPILKLFTNEAEDDILLEILNQVASLEKLEALEQSSSLNKLEIIVKIISNNISNNQGRHSSVLSDSNIFRLQSTTWLLTADNVSLAPSQVIYLPELETEIQNIIDNTSNKDWITPLQLHNKIRDNRNVLKWLSNRLFIKNDKALEAIGKILSQSPQYYLGRFINKNEFNLEDASVVFRGIQSNVLPSWELIQRVKRIADSERCKRYILDYLLDKPIEESRLIQLLGWISSNLHPNDIKAVRIYNQYLEIATDKTLYRLSENILPNILLISRNKQWQPSYKLWYGQDRSFFNTIDHTHILDEQQAKILEDHININNSEVNNIGETINEIELSAIDKYKLLKGYFQNWEPPAHSEAIGAFIGLIAGSNQSLQQLSQEFLGRRDLLDIWTRLTGKSSFPSFEFDIEVSSRTTQEIYSITGQKFTASLISNNSNISVRTSSLFVSPLDASTRKLVISPIDNPQNYGRDRLHERLKKSAQGLIGNVYQIDKSTSNEKNEKFEDIWSDLTKSDQLELQVARNVILEGASFVIEMLGVHQKNEIVKDLLNQMQKAIYQKVDYKNSKREYTELDRQIDNIKEKLASELEDPSPNNLVSSDFLESVREKIRMYRYSESSVPFEIFQNADDALIELEMMGTNQSLESSRLQFIIESSQNTITIMYWGRPINCFRHPHYSQNNFQDKGFERDLQKMLSFSQSNKYHTNNASNYHGDSDTQVTGKFGLGFKSIHLICREPLVFSYRTGFKIVGGWLPVKLSYLEDSNLRFALKQKNPDLVDGTVIKLKLEEINHNPATILNDFNRLIGLLLIFSKKIKTYRFFEEKQDFSYTWNPSFLQADQSIEIGTIRINQGTTRVLCFKLGNIGHFLISLKESSNGLESCLTEDIPTVWVTSPTKEKLKLSFIINAQFDLDTGRSTLSETEKNSKLAQELGRLLGIQLCSFFEKSNQSWEKVQELLNLPNTTRYQFWHWLWKDLVRSCLDMNFPTRLNIIHKILNGFVYLVGHQPTIPNGLLDGFECLVSLQDIHYVAQGILRQEKYFTLVFQWQEIQKKYKHSQIIDSYIWEQLKKLLKLSQSLNGHQSLPEILDLCQALQCQLINYEVNIQTASQVGIAINKTNLLEDIKQNSSSEYERLLACLCKVKFLNQADCYEIAGNLLDTNSLDFKEKLLSAFAPDECVLNQQYDKTGRDFFHACRSIRLGGEEENLEEERLVEWILAIKVESKRLAAIEYLRDLQIVNRNLFERLLPRLKEVDWLQEFFPKPKSEPEPEPEPEDKLVDKTKPLGDRPEWGEPGEALAGLFYNDFCQKNPSYSLEQRGGYGFNHDFLLRINGREIKIEVKTTASKSFRLTISEWNELTSRNENYELFVVEHSGSAVTRVIRIQNVWDTLQKALAKLDLQYPTSETENIESLIGLQKDNSKNIVILNWHRLIDTYGEKSKDKNKNITFYKCDAQLVSGERSVNPSNPTFVYEEHPS